MPPKKKAKLPSSNDPHESNELEDPAEFIGYIRNEGGKRFSPTKRSKGDRNSDIEQNVREVRALLKINAEIFGRCMENQLDPYYDTEVVEHYTFARYDFSKVSVHQHPSDEDRTELITEQQRSLKAFCLKSLCELPAGLNDLFVVKYQAAPYQAFVDYDALFKTAIVLHDDVLEPFLVKLKQHLESIQVCLGEIESWLLEPKSNIQFLDKTFGTKLKNLPETPLINDYTCSHADPWNYIHSGGMPSTSVCARCFNKIGAHTASCHSFQFYKFICSDGKGYFKTGQPSCQVLKVYKQSGKFETEFNIASTNDQNKLKKFIEFIS
jgi:hypothetical protein